MKSPVGTARLSGVVVTQKVKLLFLLASLFTPEGVVHGFNEGAERSHVVEQLGAQDGVRDDALPLHDRKSLQNVANFGCERPRCPGLAAVRRQSRLD